MAVLRSTCNARVKYKIVSGYWSSNRTPIPVAIGQAVRWSRARHRSQALIGFTSCCVASVDQRN